MEHPQSIEELRAYISEGLEHPIYGELFEQILLDFELSMESMGENFNVNGFLELHEYFSMDYLDNMLNVKAEG